MPKIAIVNGGTFDVPSGKRLVLALVDECGIDQLHACGGNARCTTCRVEITEGAPEQSEIESKVLLAKGLSGVRLSCQILVTQDMTVNIISRFAGSGRKDSGARPADQITI